MNTMKDVQLPHRQIILLVAILLIFSISSPVFAGFETPTNVNNISDPDINTAATEYYPSISPDGLSLYYSTPGGTSADIHVARRPNRYSPFGNASSLDGINHSTYYDVAPSVTADGLTMVYYRGDGDVTIDSHLMIVNRVSTDVPFENESTIRELSPNLRDYIGEYEPHITPDGLTLYFASHGPGGNANIYRTRRSNRSAAFAPISAVSAVNTGYHENSPFMTADELTLFFSSNRSGGTGSHDFYMVSRPDTSTAFSADDVVEVADLNSTYYERSISMTEDGTEVFIDSTRSGGSGLTDIWHSEVILEHCFKQY